MRIFYYTFAFFAFFSIKGIAQSKIKDGTVIGSPVSPDNNTLLELESMKRGFLPPRIELLSRNNPAPLLDPIKDGTLVYNTRYSELHGTSTYPNHVYPGYYYWQASTWNHLPSLDPDNFWNTNGNWNVTNANFLGTMINKPLKFKVWNQYFGHLSQTTQSISFGFQSLGQRYDDSTVINYPVPMSGSNLAFGSYSLTHVPQLGVRQSTAIGNQALEFLGYNGGTANGNVGVGWYAGGQLHSGEDNIAIGTEANVGRNSYRNISIGRQSGLQLLNSDGTILIGFKAGYGLTSSTDNIFIGRNVADTQTEGNGNIAIGSGNPNPARLPDPTGNNQLNIANSIFGTGLTGNVSSPAGNIGVNKTNPASTFEVGGSFGTAIRTIYDSTLATPQNLTLTLSDHTLVLDFPSTSIYSHIVYLPDAATCKGRNYYIINYTGESQQVMITGGLFQFRHMTNQITDIDGVPNFNSAIFQSNGQYWIRIK